MKSLSYDVGTRAGVAVVRTLEKGSFEYTRQGHCLRLTVFVVVATHVYKSAKTYRALYKASPFCYTLV